LIGFTVSIDIGIDNIITPLTILTPTSSAI